MCRVPVSRLTYRQYRQLAEGLLRKGLGGFKRNKRDDVGQQISNKITTSRMDLDQLDSN